MDTKIIEMYRKADAFDFEKIVIHCALENDESIDTVRSWVPELKKWLVMLAHDGRDDLVIFGPVDRLWHTFITFTREYAAFCEQVAGRFIHHVPAEKILEADEKGLPVDRALFETPQRVKEVRASQVEKYRNTLDRYRELFGPDGLLPSRPDLEDLGIITTVDPDHPDYDPEKDPLRVIWPEIRPDGAVTCPATSCCGGGCGCIQTRP